MRRANGSGGIFKLSGKRRNPYAVRITVGYTDDGKQLYKYLGYYKNKTEARKALEAYNTNPYDLAVKKVTVKEIYEDWRKQVKIGQSALNGYQAAFNKCTRIHDVPIRDLKVADLEKQLEGRKPSGQKLFKLLMNHLYKYAIKNEICEKNLSDFLTYETAEPKEKTIFTAEEIAALWKNVGKGQYSDIPIILLYTGMRINELLSITCDNVFLDENYMVGGSKTQAGKNRIIPIHYKIKPLIEKRMAAGRKYLLTNSHGNKIEYNTYKTTGWKYSMEAIKANHTPHEARHTFVTNMDRLDVNRVALKKIIGHTTKADITDHYTHKSIQELVDTINVLKY